MARPRLPEEVELEVLVRSRRRCALCYCLRRDIGEKDGQIAHLDRDRSHNDLENLAFLCLDHHAEYDRTSRQAKGLKLREVKAYRQTLYETVRRELPAVPPAPSSDELEHLKSDELKGLAKAEVEQYAARLRSAQLRSPYEGSAGAFDRAGGFTGWLVTLGREVDATLDRLLPAADVPPVRLHQAMRYCVLAPGKRIRPALVVLAGEALGAPRVALLPGAAALELIHTYSLVHDDLPALDDDDLRRGRPTVHRQYDEATAILTGDALLTFGLTLLAREPAGAPAEVRRQAVALVGSAISTTGMIGGQMEDIESERQWPAQPAAALERIHRGKTGALLTAALRLGGALAGGTHLDATLSALGERLGLMFQIADDLLDVQGSAAQLGKRVGKDAAAGKLTFPGLYGVAASRQRLDALREEALHLAAALPGTPELWSGLVDYLALRQT